MLYVFGGLLGRPMRLLSNAMRDFAQGDLDRRIAETRNDEFGQLFSAYNHMADGVQARVAKDRAAGTDAAIDTGELKAIAEPGVVPGADTEATLRTTTVHGRPSPEPAA
jgi:serine/threonine-protein kinase